MGRRYGGLKQLATVGPSGETLLDYAVYDAVRSGFGKLVFVIRKSFADAFHDQVGRRYAHAVEVAYAHQEIDDLPHGFAVPAGREKPWGTGHAVWAARNVIQEPFAVVNADDFYGRAGISAAAEKVRETWEDPLACHLVAYALEPTLSDHGGVSRGVCSISAGGTLEDIRETHDIRRIDGRICGRDPDGSTVELNPETPVSMNLWGLPVSIFGSLERLFSRFLGGPQNVDSGEFYLPSAVHQWAREEGGVIQVSRTRSPWIGITYAEDRKRAQDFLGQLVAAGEYCGDLGAAFGSERSD